MACEVRCIHQQHLKSTIKQSSAKNENKLINDKINNDGVKKNTAATLEITESYTIVIFVSDSNEIKELEKFSLVRGEQLINLCIPNVVI